jgi:hypothetical protein
MAQAKTHRALVTNFDNLRTIDDTVEGYDKIAKGNACVSKLYEEYSEGLTKLAEEEVAVIRRMIMGANELLQRRIQLVETIQ